MADQTPDRLPQAAPECDEATRSPGAQNHEMHFLIGARRRRVRGAVPKRAERGQLGAAASAILQAISPFRRAVGTPTDGSRARGGVTTSSRLLVDWQTGRNSGRSTCG